MFLIPPPAGVPVSTVPQILRLANKSQRTAPLVVNYFRVDGDAFVKTQLQRGHASDVTVDNGELKMFDAKEKLTEHLKTVEHLDSTKSEATPISNILSQVTFDDDEWSCVNLVVEVRYRFFW